MALFAPAVLLLDAREAFTAGTAVAAQIFLIARVVFVPVYAMALPVPFLRTIFWMAGFLATLYLYLMAL